MLDSFQMWACEYIQLCMPKPEKPQLFAQKQALGGSLFYLWFSLLFMFYPGFRSSRQPGKQTNKLSGQIKQVFSLRVPALCLGTLADCLTQDSRSHAAFRAFIDGLFFAIQLPGHYIYHKKTKKIKQICSTFLPE